MSLKNRLAKLEATASPVDVTRLWTAWEIAPGRFRLDDGRELSEQELDELPGSGLGLDGLVICLPDSTAGNGV